VFSFIGFYLNMNESINKNNMFIAGFAMSIITVGSYLLYHFYFLYSRIRDIYKINMLINVILIPFFTQADLIILILFNIIQVIFIVFEHMSI
jgi:hypothetical protein